MIIEVAASEMLLLRMLSRRLDMPTVLVSFPVGERPCCEAELADFWGWAESEDGPSVSEVALETMVVRVIGELEALLKKALPLFSEGNALSS